MNSTGNLDIDQKTIKLMLEAKYFIPSLVIDFIRYSESFVFNVKHVLFQATIPRNYSEILQRN